MSRGPGPADVEIGRDGAVQTMRFARVEKKNAITASMYVAMTEALQAADNDASIAVTLFLGAPEIFSAGNDIKDFIEAASKGEEIGPAVAFIKALASSQHALLAGVDGLAVGIGTTLLLHCDYVLATRRSLFRTPFAPLGLVPEAASSLVGPRLMGHPRAFELLVMGRGMTAEAALAAGIVNALVEPAELEGAAADAARELASLPREAMLASRRLLKGDTGEIVARIDQEVALFAERMRSGEAQAAFKAFVERGKP